jgi:hypothetical protein
LTLAYDGSGVFTVLYNWATEAASPPIAISKLDTEMAGIATALSSCALRTGGTFTGQVVVSHASGIVLSGTESTLFFKETDAATDEQYWRFVGSGGNFYLQTRTDALGGGTNAFALVRSGTTVDSITFAGTTIAITGNETVSGTLGVTGATTLSSTLAVTGNVAVATNKFTVTAASGNTLVAGTLTVGTIDITPTQGSFTMSLRETSDSGTVIATGTAYWQKIGKCVTLRIPSLSAASTATAFYITGIPAGAQVGTLGESGPQYIPGTVINASGNYPGLIGVTEAVGAFPLYSSVSAWTSGSSSKGVGHHCITYQVAD